MEMDKTKIFKDIKANSIIISSKLEKSSLIIKLVYEIEKRKIIKFFDDNFYKLNKKKLKIIINNKLSNLTKNYMIISHNNMKVLKIKLIIINSHEINFNKMFYNCNSLKDFSLITKLEPKIKNKTIDEQKENQVDILNINNSEEIIRQSSIELNFFNKSNDETGTKVESNDIFDSSYYKNTSKNLTNINDTLEKKKQQVYRILFHSHNFYVNFHHLIQIYFNIIIMRIN